MCRSLRPCRQRTTGAFIGNGFIAYLCLRCASFGIVCGETGGTNAYRLWVLFSTGCGTLISVFAQLRSGYPSYNATSTAYVWCLRMVSSLIPTFCMVSSLVSTSLWLRLSRPLRLDGVDSLLSLCTCVYRMLARSSVRGPFRQNLLLGW